MQVGVSSHSSKPVHRRTPTFINDQTFSKIHGGLEVRTHHVTASFDVRPTYSEV